MSAAIHRTVFTLEVFSEGPLQHTDLHWLAGEIDEGPCIGDFTQVSTEVVPPADVEAHLLRIGNDGTFFADEDDPVITDFTDDELTKEIAFAEGFGPYSPEQVDEQAWLDQLHAEHERRMESHG